MNHILWQRILRFFIVLVCLIVGGYLAFQISTVTYPFIIAIIFAYLINPIVNTLEQRLKMHRVLAVFLSLLFVFLVLGGMLTLIIIEIVSGSKYLSEVLPKHFENLVSYFEQFVTQQIIPLYNQGIGLFNNLDSEQQSTIVETINELGTNIGTQLSAFLQFIISSVPNFLSWLPNVVTVLVFSLLATFFISKDWNRLKTFLQGFLPSKVRTSGKTVFIDLQSALFGFIRAQFTLISITAVIVIVGLLILRVDHAITIGLLIGLVDLLPYLGTGLVFVPWVIYALFAGNSGLAIGLSVLYIIIVVQRQIMEPKVLSSNIGLDPLATLVALFVGFKLFGFLGLIIGPVTFVILKTLYEAGVVRDVKDFIMIKK
ncbi:sporulation integral membrane protein YtvI [Bacillus solimangrovi]|uniref:Sporulation integral membrane protein YtvI n=1 Tax=Bacillus solimangrovi TaxID=1305675 RepID=A0A1E5LCW4_9BACI|nr:sporulation integral membrane protein YtvI [Bacillus solimangrovi]